MNADGSFNLDEFPTEGLDPIEIWTLLYLLESNLDTISEYENTRTATVRPNKQGWASVNAFVRLCPIQLKTCHQWNAADIHGWTQQADQIQWENVAVSKLQSAIKVILVYFPLPIVLMKQPLNLCSTFIKLVFGAMNNPTSAHESNCSCLTKICMNTKLWGSELLFTLEWPESRKSSEFHRRGSFWIRVIKLLIFWRSPKVNFLPSFDFCIQVKTSLGIMAAMWTMAHRLWAMMHRRWTLLIP